MVSRVEAVARKFKIVVSDLHLGAGFRAQGNVLEDFSDHEFAVFLRELAAESRQQRAGVELIINGDAFEMLQVPHVDRFDPQYDYLSEHYRSTAEPDASRKMALIIEGHPGFFAAIREFLSVGPPRRTLTFIKGNHDVELHWTAVQERIREAVDAMGDRVDLVRFEERRVSREGIYVEHGCQYAESMSRVPDMDEPHDPEKPGQLALPWGSRFTLEFLNVVERDAYWVDGIKPVAALVWYAIAFDFAFAARALVQLIKIGPGVLLDGLRSASDPRSGLVRQLDDPSRVAEVGRRYGVTPTFRDRFNDWVADILGDTPLEDSAREVAGRGGADAEEMGDSARRAVRFALSEAASSCAERSGAQVVVFGHTHEPLMATLSSGVTYTNTGTWVWSADFGDAGKESWRDLFEHPERFTHDRQFHYARIDYDEDGRASGQLLRFQPSLEPAREPWWARWCAMAREWWQRVKDWIERMVRNG